jgi:hypothetical protein
MPVDTCDEFDAQLRAWPGQGTACGSRACPGPRTASPPACDAQGTRRTGRCSSSTPLRPSTTHLGHTPTCCATSSGVTSELNNEDLVDALAEIGDPKSVVAYATPCAGIHPGTSSASSLARRSGRSVRSAPPRRWRSSARLPATRARSRARRRSTSYDARRADRGPPCRLRVGIRTSRDTLTGLPPALRDARVSHPPSSRPARCRARRSARGSRDRRRTAPATGAAA